MPSPAEIISSVSSLMNDTAQTSYNNEAVLPYLNMALRDLQEIFELNNVATTNATSTSINVPAGTTTVRFALPNQVEALPALPVDLIDIQQLWESGEGLNNWIPMKRVEFLPHFLANVQVNQFLYWAWIDQEIRLPEANADIDLRIDYIKSMFQTITDATIEVQLPFRNIYSYLQYRTAALCSQYIGENETRSTALMNDALIALERATGISVKGKQSITTRRRPFRQSWKAGANF
jgi:hypothetical protein